MKAADLFDGEMLTQLHRDLHPFRSQIADREQVRVALALARQKRIAAANARLERGFIDGVGAVVASIDADLYHRFGLMYGYETVNSPDFVKSLLRDNPECRVETKSRFARVVVPEWEGNKSGSQEGRNGERKVGVDTAPVGVAEGELTTDDTEGTDGEGEA